MGSEASNPGGTWYVRSPDGSQSGPHEAATMLQWYEQNLIGKNMKFSASFDQPFFTLDQLIKNNGRATPFLLKPVHLDSPLFQRAIMNNVSSTIQLEKEEIPTHTNATKLAWSGTKKSSSAVSSVLGYYDRNQIPSNSLLAAFAPDQPASDLRKW
uniref:GYF domain-containing protein n=1 Tax=Panagrolaimus sp. ES5 TaxID=591445 RepID=A0AC34GL02_9BILA